MRKLDTLFKQFINAPIQIFRGSTFTKGLSELTQVYDNTESGDLVIVKGNHNIQNNSIQLKDGVNWSFVGNPIISSDSFGGTFNDSGVLADVYFDGNLIIQNTTSHANRILLTNVYSSLKGFAFVFDAIINCDATDITIPKIIINNFNEIPTPSYDTIEGYAFITFANNLIPSTNTNVNINYRIINRLNDESLVHCSIGAFGNNVINIRAYNSLGISTSFNIKIKVEISYE